MKLRIRKLCCVSCLLLTSLFLSPGCGDPQYGVVSKPRDTDQAPTKPKARKDLPKNQYRAEDLKSDKLRGE